MQEIRRLYLYAMSGVTLAVLAAGLRLLVSVLLDALGLSGDQFGGESGNREQLSLAGALVGVGLPVWAIHWALVRRSLRPGAPEADEERGSSIRATYLSAVLAVSLVFAATAAIDLVGAALLSVLGVTTVFGGRPDVAGTLATLVIAGGIWLFHALVRRVDMAAGPLRHGAAAWPRVYLYGVMLVALVVGIGAIRHLVDAVAELLTSGAPAFGEGHLQLVVASQVAITAVMAIAFVAHAWYAERLLDDPGWRGLSERPALVRVAFFAIVLGLAGVFVLTDLITAARAILLEVLGDGQAAGERFGGQPPSVGRVVVVALLGALPWLLAGLAVRRQALAEAGRSDQPGRRLSVARLEEYLLSVIGLAYGAVALGWLLGLAIDTLLGGNRVAALGSGWRPEIASFLPAAVFGLALWAWRWSWIVLRAGANPIREADSSIRRIALLVVLAVSIIAAVAALAVILHRLFGSLLGIDFGGSVVSALSTPLGALIVAAAVAAYHGLLVRRDGQLRGRQAGPDAGVATTTTPERPPSFAGPAQRMLVLRAPSQAALDATLAGVRSGLPAGTRLDDA